MAAGGLRRETLVDDGERVVAAGFGAQGRQDRLALGIAQGAELGLQGLKFRVVHGLAPGCSAHIQTAQPYAYIMAEQSYNIRSD